MEYDISEEIQTISNWRDLIPRASPMIFSWWGTWNLRSINQSQMPIVSSITMPSIVNRAVDWMLNYFEHELYFMIKCWGSNIHLCKLIHKTLRQYIQILIQINFSVNWKATHNRNYPSCTVQTGLLNHLRSLAFEWPSRICCALGFFISNTQ